MPAEQDSTEGQHFFDQLLQAQVRRMRLWTWVQLRADVDSTRTQLHEFRGRTVRVETDVFWDDDPEEDLRVAVNVRFPDGQSEAHDSFIMARDGSFVGE